MKKTRIRLVCISVVVLCVFALGTLCGCETVKGMGRDIKNADRWFREHAW